MRRRGVLPTFRLLQMRAGDRDGAGAAHWLVCWLWWSEWWSGGGCKYSCVFSHRGVGEHCVFWVWVIGGKYAGLRLPGAGVGLDW